jgi:hypothetical protein
MVCIEVERYIKLRYIFDNQSVLFVFFEGV